MQNGDNLLAWDGIEEVVAAADAGSFAGGAATLGVSTSHVSRAVARLEGRLGTPIFFRTTRRMLLSDSGRLLVERFRRLIEERDHAFALLERDEEPRGELRITCSTYLGERVIAPEVRRFIADHPRVSVTLDLNNRVVDLLAEGYDLAIRTGFTHDPNLIQTRIGSRKLHLCAAPAYLRRAGRPGSVTGLDDHECLIGSAPWHFKLDGQEITLSPKGRFRCNSGTAIAEAAVAGMGICQLPDFYVREHIAAERLETLLESATIEDEPIFAVSPAGRHLQARTKTLVQRLERRLAQRRPATQVTP